MSQRQVEKMQLKIVAMCVEERQLPIDRKFAGTADIALRRPVDIYERFYQYLLKARVCDLVKCLLRFR